MKNIKNSHGILSDINKKLLEIFPGVLCVQSHMN